LFDLVPQCKHLLAVHLAEALGEFNSKTISDEDFAAYMSFDNTTNDKSARIQVHRPFPGTSNDFPVGDYV